jgi:phosphotransferase system enzyme I (PtsI)
MVETAQQRVLAAMVASGGIAMGPLAVVQPDESVSHIRGSVEEEDAILGRAINQARQDLAALIAAHDDLAGGILEFQEALLEDEDLLAPVYARIADGAAASEAWREVMDGEIAEYRSGDDEYMAARADDLVDLKQRVLRIIARGDGVGLEVPEGAILVTDTLTPSMFLEYDWPHLAGAAITGGSPTSHVAILARARGVPLIVCLQAEAAMLEEGAEAVLDGETGQLIIWPDKETLTAMQARQHALAKERDEAAPLIDKPARTKDGRAIKVLINVDDPELLTRITPEHCDGIGLARTEFLFTEGRLPDEEKQVLVYRRLLDWAAGRPVTIRTLDAGGDKPIAGVTVDGEQNPFLGIRGVRLHLLRRDLLEIQLRALLRAAAHGPLKILVPMVTLAEELEEVRKLMGQMAADLDREGLEHGKPRLGMMVEVPAAALMATDFAADFYSIGSNDLVQYTMAAARDNPAVAHLARAGNPAVLELIARTIKAGKARQVEVSLCGDMASSPEYAGRLVDLGLENFSVSPAQIGAVKLAISRLDSAAERP